MGGFQPAPRCSETSGPTISAALPGSARLGSARLGSVRLGSARLGSARPGSARLLGAKPRPTTSTPAPGCCSRGGGCARLRPCRARSGGGPSLHPPAVSPRMGAERDLGGTAARDGTFSRALASPVGLAWSSQVVLHDMEPFLNGAHKTGSVAQVVVTGCRAQAREEPAEGNRPGSRSSPGLGR